MNWKDIAGLVIAAIAATPAIFGAYKFFKDVSWFLPRATKYSHLLEKYAEYLDPQEIEFLKAEMKKDVKRSILGIKNIGYRELILYVRTHSDLIMPSWRWVFMAPLIHKKYGKFFIPYKGRYRRYRYISICYGVFIIIWGLMYPLYLLYSFPQFSFVIVLGLLLMLVCVCTAVMFWILLPGKKALKKYNSELVKIDASKYQAQ